MSIHPEQHPLDGKLEPETKDCFNDRAPLYSIAISLKRIADAPSEAAAGIVDGWRERAERAEARCRALQDALAPFAEAARLALIGGYPPVNFVGAVEFEHAAQALSLSGGGGREEKGSLPESPSADAGPYPRSRDDQHSDGVRG